MRDYVLKRVMLKIKYCCMSQLVISKTPLQALKPANDLVRQVRALVAF
jgi:hypothetical protein